MSIDRVTFGIVTFNRPELCRRLVDSIYAKYPGACVVVADNGWEKPILPRAVRVLQMARDVGLSASRNELASQCQTSFLLILDDDFIFTEQTRIESLVSVLDADDWIGVAGGRLKLGKYMEGPACVFTPDGTVTETTAATEHTDDGVEFIRCEHVLNFALFRLALLEDERWDANLKMGEHWEFFYRLKQRTHWQVASVPSVVAKHCRDSSSQEYRKYRHRAREYGRQAKEKWGFA